MSKKGLFMGAVLLFIISITQAVFAEPADITGHWAADDINQWIAEGIVEGNPDGSFKPDDPVTRAQFAAFINRIFNFQEKSDTKFKDVTGGEWYAQDISKAAAAGFIEGYGDTGIQPEKPVSRQEAAVMLARVFELKARNTNASYKFSDADQIAGWSRDAVSAMLENGYVSGREDNKFAPGDSITRAEAVKMIGNVTGTLKSKPGTYDGVAEGNLVVNTGDVSLKDMTVKGNLYLTQGIGEGNAYLDGVTVNGNTIVRGGGEHSININDSALNGTLIVHKRDGKIRVVAKGSTDIAGVEMKSGGTLEEDGVTGKGFVNLQTSGTITGGQLITVKGDFSSILLDASRVNVRILDGNIDKLAVKEGAAGAAVKMENGSIRELTVDDKANLAAAGGKINNLVIGTKAAGSIIQADKNAQLELLTANANVTVKGEGKISSANINTNGVTMDQKPDNLNIKEGMTANIAGKEESKSTSQAAPAAGVTVVGGGGGGGGTPPAGNNNTAGLEVRSAMAVVGEEAVNAVKQGNEWVVDLSGKEGSKLLTEIAAVASPNAVQASMTYIGITKTVDLNQGTISMRVEDILGEFDTGTSGVYLSTMRTSGLPSTFSVTLKGSDNTTVTVTIRLIL